MLLLFSQTVRIGRVTYISGAPVVVSLKGAPVSVSISGAV